MTIFSNTCLLCAMPPLSLGCAAMLGCRSPGGSACHESSFQYGYDQPGSAGQKGIEYQRKLRDKSNSGETGGVNAYQSYQTVNQSLTVCMFGQEHPRQQWVGCWPTWNRPFLCAGDLCATWSTIIARHDPFSCGDRFSQKLRQMASLRC